MLFGAPVYGGWWTNYEDESWCHKVVKIKYCLPEAYELERVEGTELSFIARRDDLSPSTFVKFKGDDALEEYLKGLMVPDGATVQSGTHINGLRIIRLITPEADHSILIILVVFPDESFVQIFGGQSTQVESTVNEFIQPIVAE